MQVCKKECKFYAPGIIEGHKNPFNRYHNITEVNYADTKVAASGLISTFYQISLQQGFRD
jgi:hypothetical protein